MRTNKKHGKPPLIFSIIPFILIILVLGTLLSGKGIIKFWRLSGMLDKEKQKYQGTIAYEDSLKKEKNRLLTDSLYIEEIARRDFGMIKIGEKVYNITPSK